MVLDQVGIHLRRAVDHADGSDRYALHAKDTDVPTSVKHRINGLNLEPATGRGHPGASQDLRLTISVRNYLRENDAAAAWNASRIRPPPAGPLTTDAEDSRQPLPALCASQGQSSAALRPGMPDPHPQAA